MNFISKLTVVLFLLISSSAFSMILPPNHLDKFDNPKRIANIDEALFNKIVDSIIEYWQPIAKLHGANLSSVKRWNDSTVNAYADQSGASWTVHMFGGLARRPEVTPEAFALVVCHELGHHFGGYFFYEGGGPSWAAAEGEADYWATQTCGRVVFSKSLLGNHRYREGVPAIVKDKCDASWKTPQQQDECYRLAAGGLSLATLLSAVGGSKVPPKFETPDQKQVSKTNSEHPEAQCRLDTYFSGALCPAMFDLRVIPGRDEQSGQGLNTPEVEAFAAKSSCFAKFGIPVGNRPACWFKPLVNFH